MCPPVGGHIAPHTHKVSQMARAPFQVLVYPYRPFHDNDFEYALLKRSDAGY